MTNIIKSDLLNALKDKAMRQMSLYPQYDGHFEKYQLVLVDRDIRTKMGLAFEANEYAIMKPDRFPSMSNYVTVWSMRNGCDTSVPRSAIQHIIEPSNA